jgi:hypothetical protein
MLTTAEGDLPCLIFGWPSISCPRHLWTWMLIKLGPKWIRNSVVLMDSWSRYFVVQSMLPRDHIPASITDTSTANYWVLAIALCTYFILASEKHKSSSIPRTQMGYLDIPWLLFILWAILGLALVGYGDIGAWYWFPSHRTRLLVNFVPHWLIIISCTLHPPLLHHP